MVYASTSKASLFAIAVASLPAFVRADASDASFPYNQQPSQPWQGEQIGTNDCVNAYGQSNQTALCQTAVINSADDFCLWAPPYKPDVIANTERYEVAWCTKSGYGTRLIPDGTLTGVHFTKAANYVQVVALGDFTKINILAGDEGGELDPHGADGNGNPEGGLVYTNAFGLANGQPQQVHQWMSFISSGTACFRACLGGTDEYQQQLCQHIYDVMGCNWVMPSTKYNDVSFDSCDSDNGDPPGIYNNFASTWYQGDPPCAACAPPAHDPPATSNCSPIPSVSNGVAVALAPSSTSAASSSGASSSMSASSTMSSASGSGGSTSLPVATSASSAASRAAAAVTSVSSTPNAAAGSNSAALALGSMAVASFFAVALLV